jgi:hypothetical protein
MEFKDFNSSLLKMNAFLNFSINDEIMHRFWDSVDCRNLLPFLPPPVVQKKEKEGGGQK